MKIVIATGGTGGHIFPALETALELKRGDHEVVFVGVFGKLKFVISENGFAWRDICAKGLSTASFKKFLESCFCMGRAVIQSLKILKTERPDVVCGFGGYGAFAAVISAVFLRRRAMIHEQNVVPGKANAVLSRFVRKIAVSFQESEFHFPKGKSVLTGCPCHAAGIQETKQDVLRSFGFSETRPTLLVLGGSQGSRKLNEVVLETVSSWGRRSPVQIFHIAGDMDYGTVQNRYKALDVEVRIFDFFKEMEKLYTAADMVISRSGAVTVTELLAFGLPAVLVPHPGAGGHQKKNAQLLSRLGLARIIEDRELDPAILINALDGFLHERPSQQAKAKARELFVPDAARRVADAIVSLGRPYA
jgi:UDP-N-acetylglucosamine--N-acetylmuramyl-(pentapeptide) pyrophosphoryl-undecaprenol N-acetylglucosamine transferase